VRVPFWRATFRYSFPSGTIVPERSSPSRVRSAAPNNGAPLTAPGRSEQPLPLRGKSSIQKAEGQWDHLGAKMAPFFHCHQQKLAACVILTVNRGPKWQAPTLRGAIVNGKNLIIIAAAMTALLPQASASFIRATGDACVSPSAASPFACSQSVEGATINAVFTAGTGTATVSANSQSAYGVLHSQAGASFTGSTTPELIYVNGAAGFSDEITISFAPFTGSTGYLLVGFTLDGTISNSGSLNAAAYVNAAVGSTIGQVPNFTSSAAGQFFFPETFSFVYGTPFGLYFNLGTVAGSFNPGPPGRIFPYTATASGSGDSDFEDTLVLTALDVVDSQGNPVSGVTFTSESGTQYSADGVVPEPSTPLLVGAGIVAIGVLRFRARKSKSA
jgi:hypothetical protein